MPWQFSRLRTALDGLRPWWVAALVALVWLAWTPFARSRSWGGREACALFLLLFAGSAIVVAVVGDGFVALDQHLLGTRFALDLLTVLVVHEMVRGLAGRVRSHRTGVPIRRAGGTRSRPTSRVGRLAGEGGGGAAAGFGRVAVEVARV